MCAEIWRRDFWRKSFAGPLSTPADWRRQRQRRLPACLAAKNDGLETPPCARPGRKCGQAKKRDGVEG